ncbi:hypothetical protein [Cupriavidus sp. CP313]
MATLSLRRINPSWRRFGFLSVLGIGTIIATNPTLRPAMTVLWALVLIIFRPKQPLVSVRDEILAWARLGFPAFSPTFALIGDREQSGFLFDEAHDKVIVYCERGAQRAMYSFRDLMKSDLIDDGSSVTSTSRTSQLAGAIVGGVLFGGVGAIVGGLTGKKNNARTIKELALHIVVNDRAKPLFVIDVLALRKAVARDKVKAQVLHTQKAQALIAGLIKTADDEDRAKEREQLVAIAAPKPAAPERLSFADEFMKLAKLRQEGALSEQEFTDLKAELIPRAKPVSA